jgi:hypothetical protein
MTTVKPEKNSFTIGGETVQGGEARTVELPVARLYTHTQVTLPVRVVCGQQPGPNLFVSGAMHGDEICGVEIVRRLLARKSLNKLRGTLVAVPVVNVHGFISHSRYLPDRRDLNRCFPGREDGSLATHLAWLFMTEIVRKCQFGIDLHTAAGARFNLPQLRGNTEDAQTLRLARAFGAPVIINANLRDGSLRQAALEEGLTMLLYEAGEVLRFDEFGVRLGVAGIVSVMRVLGMLPGRPYKPRFEPFITSASTWARAPQSGIFCADAALGAWVAKGQRLGAMTDPMGEREIIIEAPVSGLIIAVQKMPLANKGDALYHIAKSEDPEQERPEDLTTLDENGAKELYPRFGD